MTPALYSVRAVRLIGIVGFLSRRDALTSAKQISDQFGVAIRTVYRDVEDLRRLGLTVSGSAGNGYLARRTDVNAWLNSLLYRNPAAATAGVAPNISERRFMEASRDE